MRQITPEPLSASSQQRLHSVQTRINAAPDLASRVASAKTQWGSKRSTQIGRQTFDEIQRQLTTPGDGVRRCHYCEDSRATDIEHFRPKTLYPELCFVWENYLFACSGCNSHEKGARFAVITPQGLLLEVDDALQQSATPSAATDPPALPDPRREDPMQLMILDLVDTFEFICLTGTPVDELRVAYTVDGTGALFLNKEDLCLARRNAYRAFLNNLELCHHARVSTNPSYRRAQENILRHDHRTVWLEMKRQHKHIQELALAFRRVPEALDW